MGAQGGRSIRIRRFAAALWRGWSRRTVGRWRRSEHLHADPPTGGGVVETNRRPNVGDRWTRIAVRAVWRVAAIPGSGRGGRAEPYTALWSAHRAVFDEASGRERQACGIHCTILAHISAVLRIPTLLSIVQLYPTLTERKSGSGSPARRRPWRGPYGISWLL